MANALYYLALNASAYKRLQTIIDGIFPSGDSTFSYDQVKSVPYLEGIINETLRLKPVIPSGQPRVTPPSGLQIDEVWIPGDVNVILPQWVIQRDERYYERAKEFTPERWIPGEDQASLIKDKDAFFPFQLGKQLVLIMLLAVTDH
jgi:cytochrome P450